MVISCYKYNHLNKGLILFSSSSANTTSYIPRYTIVKTMHRGRGGSGTSNSSTGINNWFNPYSSLSASPSSQSGGRGRGNLGMEGNSQSTRDSVGGAGVVDSNENSSISNSFTSSVSLRSEGRGRGVSGAGRGNQNRGRGGPSASGKIDALDRLLTRILRHQAAELNLDMRNDGYVRVKELLKLKIKSRANFPLSSHSVDEILEAVRTDNKQRLGILEENGELWIRANQGHSTKIVETESLLKPILSADEIPVCVHGTYKRLLTPILDSGLKRMSRLHVHFTGVLPTDGKVKSGIRHNVNLLIFLDVKKALEDGMKLYKSENEVILTEGFDGVVPMKYFDKIETWPGREPVPFKKDV